MKISCIAIDDEPIALMQITSYIQKTPFLNHVASCKSAFEAMQVIADSKVDLMFVDIHMPDLNGVDFAKAVGKEQKIIFTTAYEQYAIEGFRVDAIDYLLKPFGYEEFLKSAQKALYYFDLLEKANEKDETPLDYIFVRADYKLCKIFYANILYIESQREYVKFVLENGESVISLMSMKMVEEKLPKTQFMRVHRSFIVNLRCVNTIENSRIVFGKVYIPISDQYKEEFQKFLDKTC